MIKIYTIYIDDEMLYSVENPSEFDEEIRVYNEDKDFDIDIYDMIEQIERLETEQSIKEYGLSIKCENIAEHEWNKAKADEFEG